jgi:hypothetical protein
MSEIRSLVASLADRMVVLEVPVEGCASTLRSATPLIEVQKGSAYPGPVLADAEIQLAGYVHTRTLQVHPWLLGGLCRLLASCLDRPPRARERVSAEDPGPCGGRDAASGCQEVSTSMVTGTWLVRMS